MPGTKNKKNGDFYSAIGKYVYNHFFILCNTIKKKNGDLVPKGQKPSSQAKNRSSKNGSKVVPGTKKMVLGEFYRKF